MPGGLGPKPPLPNVTVAYSAPPSGNVKVEMLRLFKYQATTPDRPRVAPNSHSAAKGELHNFGMFVGLDVFQISSVLTKRMDRLVNPHEVTHALYDLRKDGYVKFHPTKSKAMLRQLTSSSASSTPIGEVPVRIQLTQAGLQRANYTEALPHTGRIAGMEVPTSPVVKEAIASVALDHDPAMQTQSLPEKEEPPISPGQANVQVQPVTHNRMDLIHLAAYADVRRVYHAERNIRQAVLALRAAGQGSLADMAEDSLKEQTDLERQITELVSELLAGGTLVDDNDTEGG